MPNPKRRHSHSRSRTGKAALRKTRVPLRACARCGALGKPHTVCENCGHYAGREVIEKDEF